MTNLPFAADAPVSVTTVGIKARDVNTLAGYYKDAVGLEEMARRPGTIVLGAGGLPLLEIEEFKAARPDDPRAAGLYHTAFLLPSRLDLAKWTRRAIDSRIEVTGASDHFVSEAIYLTDPEGNGIEIYADRPREAWSYDGGTLNIGTVRLDVENLLGELRPGEPEWTGAPAGSMVGHVHLRVGNAAEAEQWWNRELGFDTVVALGGSAVFLSTGGYHHRVGANSWQSAGAKERDADRSGLSFVEFRSKTASRESVHEDPWGNVIRIVPAAA
ncbi:VOC family protein [Mesorhizobium sp. LHD-90]|nr:VOC family protein [Mesorhizobium sp. LHD-90]MDQ6433124.1 VOC family protein [Mesorhizobium sp. LHD-90]